MATENPRVWFKSISLENVRSFGTKQTINFTDKEGNAARWNVILGDNGTGKTTVLKGLAYCFSKGIGEYEYLNQFNRTENINSQFFYTEEVNRDTITINNVNSATVYSSNDSEKQTGHLKILGVNTGSDYNKTLFAYGATRRVGHSAISRVTNSYTSNLFDENNSLINPEEWLIQTDYLRLKDDSYEKKYNTVYRIIETLFQSEAPGGLMIDTSSGAPQVKLCTHYGDVRLHELSLGYKTLIAWMVDFAKGLLDRYPDSPNPLAEPAVCLVDEIDLHLHPKFQRTIIQFLTETFPNTQFIVTAHSPLIVLAAEERPLDANIILLKREGDHTVVVNDPVDVGKWSVDQILNSDLFGYVPPASEPLTELRVERDALLAKPTLEKNEQDRLAQLDEKIGFIPFGNNQNEIKAETIIQQLANALRSQQEAQ